MMKQRVKHAVCANLEWFRRSGVMDPADGSWGVGERVAVTGGNSAIEKMLSSFPAWSMKDGYCIIEQRRADCNFQTLLLFLLASRSVGGAAERETARRLLEYLYCRSGLLFHEDAGKVPAGAWQWSHIKQSPVIYFDDEAWCVLIQLALTRLEPDWAKEFHCRERALQLADALCVGMRRSFGHPKPDDPAFWCDPEDLWLGNLRMPHWGSLGCMALAAAYGTQPKPEYAEEIRRYCRFVDDHLASWDVSEICYGLIGAAFAAKYLGDSCFGEYTARLEAELLRRQNSETGNFPSEHESEAPVGPDKVDTIYTVNWALLALECAAAVTGNPATASARELLMELLLKIQDATPAPQFAGCWRGMYDLSAGDWGGGDRYEGGAGSIYTGWTNAPISIGLLLASAGRSLLDL